MANLSPTTVYTENINIRVFLRFMLAYKKYKDISKYYELKNISNLSIDFLGCITIIDMCQYLKFLAEELKSQDQTKYNKVEAVRIFYNCLHKKLKIIDYNQFVDLEVPKYRRKTAKPMSLTESRQLLAGITETNTKYFARNYAILTLFLNTGARRFELADVLLENLDMERRILRILGKGRKERILPLNNSCILALQEYLKVRNESKCLFEDRKYLFLSDRNRKLCENGIYCIIKKSMKLAGLENRNYTTHTLRHTCATLLYRLGKVDIREIQMLLGHANLTTTQIYTHIENDDVKKAVDKNPLNLVLS
jgi:site-specific recombinase XerD